MRLGFTAADQLQRVKGSDLRVDLCAPRSGSFTIALGHVTVAPAVQVRLGFTPADQLQRVKDSDLSEGLAFVLRQLSAGGGAKQVQVHYPQPNLHAPPLRAPLFAHPHLHRSEASQGTLPIAYTPWCDLHPHSHPHSNPFHILVHTLVQPLVIPGARSGRVARAVRRGRVRGRAARHLRSHVHTRTPTPTHPLTCIHTHHTHPFTPFTPSGARSRRVARAVQRGPHRGRAHSTP